MCYYAVAMLCYAECRYGECHNAECRGAVGKASEGQTLFIFYILATQKRFYNIDNYASILTFFVGQ
jgi:hypothetical protein